jgi:hypothetical protein
MLRFWGRARRRLSLLHFLLFLRMALLHLLRLLLMALLDLLPSRFGGILFCESLVFFFLLAFKFLPILLFLRVQLFLLLLIFAVLFRVSRIWRSRPLERRKVTRVDGATRVVAGWLVGWSCVASSGISRTAVNGAAFAGGNDSATIECCGSRSGSDGRLATIDRSA